MTYLDVLGPIQYACYSVPYFHKAEIFLLGILSN